MNIHEYVLEIAEKAKEYSDLSEDVEYQKSIETEIMRILCRLYVIYNENFENKTKSLYIIKNNGRYIFINNSPFEIIYDNQITNIDNYKYKIPYIENIIKTVEDIIAIVNFYSDDNYFLLIFDENENKEMLLSFQNRFWLPEVHKKLNHIEGL